MAMRGTLSLGFATMVAAALAVAAAPSWAAGIEMIDAHSQIPGGVSEDAVLAKMDEAGIARVILSTVHHHDAHALLAFASAHRGRITASIGLKSAGFIAGKPDAVARVRRLAQAPAVGAISELMILHQQKGDRAPEIVTWFDSPAATAALDIAAARGWPLVVHIEFGFARANGIYDKYMAGLEKLLAGHPDQPIALTHMGQLDSREAARLIAAHPNLYFLTSHANPIFLSVEGGNLPWTELFSGQRLLAGWRALFVAHPERFILAFDNVYEANWRGDYYASQAKLWRSALADLPAPVAAAVAHGNAERLWQLDAAALGRVGAAAVPAGSTGATAAQEITRLDRNGDGKLSRDEYDRSARRFARVDANGDGFITAAELAAARRRRADR